MNAQTEPLRAHFPVRRMDFSFTETPKYWWDDQPFMSHFMNNLSSLFPYGEKFFVDSVRAVRDRIQDPQLQKDVSAFIGQEAMHSKEHAAYNEYAEEHGIDLERLELRIKHLLGAVSKVTTKKQDLAITCALEHFTATMAERLLRREDLSTQMRSPKMYKLWMWHAIEENEHKAVAYDVYQQVYGGYFTRTAVMLLTTVIFLGVIAGFQIHLLRRDRQLFNWRSWKHGLVTLFGLRNGYFTQLVLPWLDYFRPGFHPFDHDTKTLEKYWKDKLDFAG
ncbi:metal-dependent hydrolase [Pseudomonas citronellolis]|jgi:predicted metal-dependent hydrolase|uniref:metal-dependent hydrolase n=1 Tax=Pseudomonas citronellolis TaxID=53408 RepID=UPI002271967E|nr:metal-dependent hydrolase [Pseudomonas citronellolis]WAB90472.1 metal-dependent hydrolase [Pseudomonas citronellolis]